MHEAEQLARALQAVGLWNMQGEPTERWHRWAATQLDATMTVCACPCWRRSHHAVCEGVALVTVEIDGAGVPSCLPCATHP